MARVHVDHGTYHGQPCAAHIVPPRDQTADSRLEPAHRLPSFHDLCRELPHLDPAVWLAGLRATQKLVAFDLPYHAVDAAYIERTLGDIMHGHYKEAVDSPASDNVALSDGYGISKKKTDQGKPKRHRKALSCDGTHVVEMKDRGHANSSFARVQKEEGQMRPVCAATCLPSDGG